MNILGIDPGLTGALAFQVRELRDSENAWSDIIVDAPRLKTGKGLGLLDEREIVRLITNWHPDFIVIERQQAFPEQGLSSTFKTGYGFGLYVGICAGLGFRYAVVHPAVWQKEMLQGAVGEGKERNVLVASRLFPHASILKSKHGRADALLLAEYGRRRLVGNEE